MPPCVKVLLALEIPWHPVMLPDGVCSPSPWSLIIWIVGYFILQAMISCKFQIFMFIFSPNKQTDQSATVHAWNNKWHASSVGETSKSFGAKTFKWNFIMLQVALVSFYQCFGKISPHIRQFWRAKCSCSVCTLQFGVCPGRLVLGLRLGLCSFMFDIDIRLGNWTVGFIPSKGFAVFNSPLKIDFLQVLHLPPSPNWLLHFLFFFLSCS